MKTEPKSKSHDRGGTHPVSRSLRIESRNGGRSCPRASGYRASNRAEQYDRPAGSYEVRGFYYRLVKRPEKHGTASPHFPFIPLIVNHLKILRQQACSVSRSIRHDCTLSALVLFGNSRVLNSYTEKFVPAPRPSLVSIAPYFIYNTCNEKCTEDGRI